MECIISGINDKGEVVVKFGPVSVGEALNLAFHLYDNGEVVRISIDIALPMAR